MGATSCCSCSGDCWSTASPCTAAVAWGAADAWEQEKKHATDSTRVHDLSTISGSPAGGADRCIAAGAPSAGPDRVRSRGAPDEERALSSDRQWRSEEHTSELRHGYT